MHGRARTGPRLRRGNVAELAERGNDQTGAPVVLSGGGGPVAIEAGERLDPALIGGELFDRGSGWTQSQNLAFVLGRLAVRRRRRCVELRLAARAVRYHLQVA